MTPRTKGFLAILLLAGLVLGCAPRPPTWPPHPDQLVETAPWYLAAERFQQAAHGSLACDDCHAGITPGDPLAPHPDTARLTEEATALYAYASCQDCHPQAYAAYEDGVHAEAMADPEGIELDAQPPTCGHCHSAHYATAESRAELLVSVRETCGSCHPEALATYERNYHGQAALLGYEKTATCTDCHGAHTVLALLESGEALDACRRCHPQAGARFASYRIHAHETLDPDPDDPRAGEFQLFFWVKLFFTVLVVGVLAFFYTHTGLWFLRSLHERLRGGRHD